MNRLLLPIALLLAGSVAQAAGSDFITQKKLKVSGADPIKTVERTTDDLRSVFEKYQPALDADTRVVRPLQIKGSRREPTMSMSLEKCVLFICQTVDLNADMSTEPAKGSCDRNFVMKIDLERSSQLVTDLYQSIDVKACLKGSSLELRAEAIHAPRHERGPLQEEAFRLLKAQIDPIMKALNTSLKENAQ